MTQRHAAKLRDRIDPLLGPGEQMLDAGVIYPTRGLEVVGMEPLTKAAAEAIARVGAVKGMPGGFAESFPENKPGYINTMVLTDKRVLIVRTQPGHSEARVAKGLTMKPTVIWEVPRSHVSGIERRPRLQLLAKFRLHFIDGSSVSAMTVRRHTIDAFAQVLGVKS